MQLSAQSSQQNDDAKKCHWWQFKCDDTTNLALGLPPDAPRQGTVITVDVATNRLYLFRDGQLIDRSLAATGSEKLLTKGKKTWLFRTPQGHLKVLRKIEDPVWTKPDWAFVEAGEPIPPPDSPKRKVKGHLGKYALDLGDGIMIHGTDEYDSIGRKASHGCIRLPEDMLETVYNAATIGTSVYIFESQPPQQTAAGGSGQVKAERHSDLDFN
jgi:lipoprotein-anchoring transpeptidase ErfK/SrfK